VIVLRLVDRNDLSAHILVGPLRRAQRGERTGGHFAGICAKRRAQVKDLGIGA
jgi:hypothetical protein